MEATATSSGISFSEAKNNLSALTARANETGMPFTVLKNNKPWVRIQPLAVRTRSSSTIAIVPMRREVAVPDLDKLFEGFDRQDRICEDGFAGAVGQEAM